MVRPFWLRIFKTEWRLGIFLLLLLSIPRFVMVLNANVTKNYNLIPIIFFCMMLVPFLFLSRNGRKEIGMKKPENGLWLLYSFLIGGGICLAAYLVTWVFFEHTIGNWAVYIANSYEVSRTGLSDSDRLTYFIIYSVIGMTFSPIGEEVFYRGVLHELFSKKVGDQKARLLDSLAFAGIHLAHFGIIYTVDGWQFLVLPSLLWVTILFALSWMFSICRKRTGSILGAIFSHAGFNLAMMYVIFYYVLT